MPLRAVPLAPVRRTQRLLYFTIYKSGNTYIRTVLQAYANASRTAVTEEDVGRWLKRSSELAGTSDAGGPGLASKVD